MLMLALGRGRWAVSQKPKLKRHLAKKILRACLHGGGGPQIGEVACDGLPHLSCKWDQIKMGDYMDRRYTPPKWVTSPTWGPPPPYRQALTLTLDVIISSNTKLRLFEIHELCVIIISREEKAKRSVFQITCV